ncbi:hypothetical protein [Aeromonas dhakensis]|nr:hypothetical protein [Aeromonas dhakensis]
MNPTLDLILAHRSIRQFTAEPISEALHAGFPAIPGLQPQVMSPMGDTKG